MKTLNINFSTGYLNKYSHIKIGGKTDYLIKVKSVNDIVSAYRFANLQNLQIIPVGGGSNILFGDTGKLLIMPDRYLPKVLEIKGDKVRVSANWNINALIMSLKKHGLGGLEFLAAIPAHLGGLMMMNAGAYNKHFSDFVSEIKIITPKGDKEVLLKDEIKFGYRKSNIKGFIYEIILKPIKKSEEQIEISLKKFIEKRMLTQPLQYPNLGSVFKNPQNGFAGKLIEQLGFKGKRIGGAKVFEKHANFIINTGNAKFDDVISLIKQIKNRVKDTFSMELQTEIKVIEWQKR